MRPAGWRLLALFLGLLIIYNSNLRPLRSDDTLPARFLPFSLLVRGTLNLNDAVRVPADQTAADHYYITKARDGAWMSSYPIATPLVVTPLYVIPAWWVAHRHGVSFQVAFMLVHGMEKLSASIVAAGSAVLLWLALAGVCSPSAGLLITLIYALCSNTWVISSQGLWTHGVTELCFALLLWALIRPVSSRWSAFWAGLALAVATANRPANIIFATIFLVYFARHAGGRSSLSGGPARPAASPGLRRAEIVCYLAPLLVIGSLTLAYNLYYFGTLDGAYTAAHQAIGYSGTAGGFRGSLWKGAAGLFASPSRGLLVYSPWVAFSLWGAVLMCRQPTIRWARYLLAGVLITFLMYAKYDRWWGGNCYGPRYLTDLLPFLAFSLTPLFAAPRTRMRFLRLTFIVTVAFALWVQVIGSFYFNYQWDLSPSRADEHPERYWDWSDDQISRSFWLGPAGPQLYRTWKRLDRGLPLGAWE